MGLNRGFLAFNLDKFKLPHLDGLENALSVNRFFENPNGDGI
jgi:hypothetical protein